jgi:hypothetical protein
MFVSVVINNKPRATSVARIIYYKKYPNKNDKQIHHMDLDFKNNNLENLKELTAGQHQHIHHLHKEMRRDLERVRLTKIQKEEIKYSKRTNAEIIQYYNISRITINRIRNEKIRNG